MNIVISIMMFVIIVVGVVLCVSTYTPLQKIISNYRKHGHSLDPFVIIFCGTLFVLSFVMILTAIWILLNIIVYGHPPN